MGVRIAVSSGLHPLQELVLRFSHGLNSPGRCAPEAAFLLKRTNGQEH